MILRTGVDIIEINRLDQQRAEIRARFLERVFTPGEMTEAGSSSASLSGRFAAKEAVSKALGTGIGQVHWHDIEIRKGLAGEPLLILHGEALMRSNELGLTQWSISISHDRTHAVAIAVALGPDSRGQT